MFGLADYDVFAMIPGWTSGHLAGSASFGSRYVSLLRAAVRAGTVAQMFLEWLELIFTYGQVLRNSGDMS